MIDVSSGRQAVGRPADRRGVIGVRLGPGLRIAGATVIACWFSCLSVCRAAGGLIEGLVTFPGETPPRAMFINQEDPDCPKGISQNHLEVRQENLGLRHALVILETEGLPAGQAGARPARRTQAVLRTQGCLFVPRVQWVPLGTSLQLINADGASHQIHATVKGNSVMEVSLPSGSVRRPILQPGLYKIDCDRHPWERAWIYASKSSYVAVTDDNGRFQIPDVPSGNYRIKAWHEGWKERVRGPREHPEYWPMEETQSIHVRQGAVSKLRFDHLLSSGQEVFGLDDFDQVAFSRANLRK